MRLFGKDYPQWLEKAGFNVVEFKMQGHYSQPMIERYRLQKEEILYIVTKKSE